MIVYVVVCPFIKILRIFLEVSELFSSGYKKGKSFVAIGYS